MTDIEKQALALLNEVLEEWEVSRATEDDVTAADRRAAADWYAAEFGCDMDSPVYLSFLDGSEDGQEKVLVFTRHRIAARNAALEEAAKVADEFTPGGEHYDRDIEWDAAYPIAKAIRALMTKEPK